MDKVKTINAQILLFNRNRAILLSKIGILISILLISFQVFSYTLYEGINVHLFIYIGLYIALIVTNSCFYYHFNYCYVMSQRINHYLRFYLSMNVLLVSLISYRDIILNKQEFLFLLIYFLIAIMFMIDWRFIVLIGCLSGGITGYAIYHTITETTSFILYIFYFVFIIAFAVVLQHFIGRSYMEMIENRFKSLVEIERSRRLAIELERANEKLELANSELEKLAMFDPLTRLPNRRAMSEFLQMASKSHPDESAAVFIIDVDYFKQYNDFYGHPAGDVVLQKIGAVFSELSATNNYHFTRWGGEEFLAFKWCEPENVRIACEQIKKEIDELAIAHEASPISEHVTISIGAYCDKFEVRDWKSFYKNADILLYEAKNSGRNKYRYEVAPSSNTRR